MDKIDEIKISKYYLKSYMDFTNQEEIKIKFIYSENIYEDTLEIYNRLNREMTEEHKNIAKDCMGLTFAQNNIEDEIIVLIKKSLITDSS